MPAPGGGSRETFASLLDSRERAAGGPAAEAPRRPKAAAHAMGAILGSAPERVEPPPIDAIGSLTRVYADETAAAEPVDPPACHPEALARELQLEPGMSPRDLERIRRNFALANHPDRVAPPDRDLATRRMALANVLIDQALRQSRR
jgi:hypothetical protein